MSLGERLRQARLEAGLSQRQLCGERITRNMLSQLESGAASPSVATLSYLAARLGKPVGYFLEEEIPSTNQQVMEKARKGTGWEVLEALKEYAAPDAVFDRERWLLEALACLELAERALKEEKRPLAWSLLEQAASAGAKTPYYTPQLERHRLCLACRVRPEKAGELTAGLEPPEELLPLARAALEAGEPERCGTLLDAFPQDTPLWHLLRGEAYFAQGAYQKAAPHYHRAEEAYPHRVYSRLEVCYREQEDYKMAYQYACRQRK